MDFLTDYCPIFPETAHFKFLAENRLSFSQKIFFLTLTKTRPTLPSNLRILVSA